ncbi:hypothetical protein H0H92_000448, partial [Tricholoma furcatifolium]
MVPFEIGDIPARTSDDLISAVPSSTEGSTIQVTDHESISSGLSSGWVESDQAPPSAPQPESQAVEGKWYSIIVGRTPGIYFGT